MDLKTYNNKNQIAHTTIPHICHLNHLYIGGEKSVMGRKFQTSMDGWSYSSLEIIHWPQIPPRSY